MNKTVYRIMSILMALSLTLGIFTSGRAESELGVLMPERLVNLAYFYKPPSNSDAATVARNFGSIILTGGDENFRDQLVANGLNSTILQYYMFMRIEDPGDCTSSPRRNQVAYKAGDFCAISRDHPDWFLLDANGQRMRADPGSSHWRMDPANPGWREFFLTRILEWQQQYGWSGLFLDNVECSIADMRRYNQIAARYPDDASWRAATIDFLGYLKTNYAQAYNRPILGNIITGCDEASWLSIVQNMDGSMREHWAVDWGTGQYVSESKWEKDMQLAEKNQNQGKYMILVAQGGTQTDTTRQAFAFASYLLISNGKAAFRYGDSSIYREVWLYDNYRVDLGTPLGPRYKTGSIWRRDFTRGFVTVDPVSHAATISTGSLPTSTPTAVPNSPTPTVASPTPLPPTATPTRIAPTPTRVQPTATPVNQPSATPTQVVSAPTNTPVPATPTVARTPVPPAAGSGTTYDDSNPIFVYSTGWWSVSESSAYGGSYKKTTRNGATVTIPFTGQSFSIIYKGGNSFAKFDVLVDGVSVGTLNQKLSVTAYQQRWDYPGQLVAGRHTLKLVFQASSSTSNGSLDAVIVR